MQKTRSESLFERWLDTHGLEWHPIPTGPAKSPDYAVTVAPDHTIIFELKQIETARNWTTGEVHGGEVGAYIRERINGSKAQIQKSARAGLSTVLVVFNAYDPLQCSGTEDHDFICAMYGEYTVKLGLESGNLSSIFHGKNKSFQGTKNTSFSALARLKESGREASISLTIFENIHAAVPIDFAALPDCFEICPIP